MTTKSPLPPRNNYGICEHANGWLSDNMIPAINQWPFPIGGQVNDQAVRDAAEKAAKAHRDQRRTVALPGIAYDRATAPETKETLDPANAGDAMFIRARHLAKGEGPLKFTLVDIRDLGNSVDYRYSSTYDGMQDLGAPVDSDDVIEIAEKLFIAHARSTFQKAYSQMKESRVVRVAIVTDSDIAE